MIIIENNKFVNNKIVSLLFDFDVVCKSTAMEKDILYHTRSYFKLAVYRGLAATRVHFYCKFIGGSRTLSRTTITTLDCASVINALIYVIPKNGKARPS